MVEGFQKGPRRPRQPFETGCTQDCARNTSGNGAARQLSLGALRHQFIDRSCGKWAGVGEMKRPALGAWVFGERSGRVDDKVDGHQIERCGSTSRQWQMHVE